MIELRASALRHLLLQMVEASRVECEVIEVVEMVVNELVESVDPGFDLDGIYSYR